MSFVHTAHEVMRLSSAHPAGAKSRWRERTGEIYERMQSSGGHDSTEDYLRALPEDVVMKLRTLMYVGKDKPLDIPRVHQGLNALTHNKADAIRAMTSKVLLSEYLRKGLEIAEAQGTNLEAEF